MTDKTQDEVLATHIALGAKAKQAYNIYLKDFISQRRYEIFQQFQTAEFNTATLEELKRCDMALADLEGTILSTIAVGAKAEQTLKDTTK